MYNKRQFHKYNDKKVLHKVKKQWVVMSLALLTALGTSGMLTMKTHAKVLNNVSPNHNSKATNGQASEYTLRPSLTGNKLQSQSQASGKQRSIQNQADTLYQRIMQHQAQAIHQITLGGQPNKGVVPQPGNHPVNSSSANSNNQTTSSASANQSQAPQNKNTPSNSAKTSSATKDNNVASTIKQNVGNVANNDNSKNAVKKPSINLKSSNPDIITGHLYSDVFNFNTLTGALTTTTPGHIQGIDSETLLTSNGTSINTNNIKSISFGAGTMILPNATADFANLPNLQSIDLSNLDTRGVTNMNGMFSNDPKLQSITFGSHFNTSDVTNMSGIFNGDSQLRSIDLSQSNPNTSNVTNMSWMFSNDPQLYSVGLGSKFNATNTTDMSLMFYNDPQLTIVNSDLNPHKPKSIDLTAFKNTSNVTNLQNMFSGDTKISDLDLGNFDTRNGVGNMANMLSDVKPSTLVLGSNTELSSNSGMNNLFYKKDSNDSYTPLTPQQIDTGTPEPGTYYSKMNPAPGAHISGMWGTAPFQLTFTKENGTVKGTLKTTGPGQIDGINNLSHSIPLQDVDDITFAPGTVAPTDSSDLLGGNTTTIYTSDGMAEQASSLANVSDIDCTNLNTSNVTNMSYMFQNDTNLKKIEFGNKFDTSKVQSMAYMFTDDYHLGSVLVSDHEADHKLTVQPLLLDLSDFNTGQVEQMAGMFQNDYGLIELNLGNNFDTSNALTINDMFNGDHSLTTLDLGSKFDTSSVDGVNKEHTYITYSDGMNGMFANDYNLKSLNLGDKFNTSNVNSMSDMFANDANLTNLNLGNQFDTSNVKRMSNMFAGNTAIKVLNLGDLFNTTNASDMHDMFANDVNLQELDLGNNFSTNKASSSTIQEYGQIKSDEGSYIVNKTVNEGHHNGAQNVFQNDKSLNTVSGSFELKGSVDLPSVTGQSWYQQTASDQPTGLPLNIANGQQLNGTYGLYTSNQIVKTTLNFQDVNHGNQSIGHINIAGFSNTYIPDSVIANSLGAGYVPDISWTTAINGVKMVQTFPNTPYKYISGTVNIPVKKDSNVSNGDSSSVLPQQNAMGDVKVTYLDGSNQNEGNTSVTSSQLSSLNTAAGMPGVNISQFLTTGFPASYKLKNSINPIVVPTSDVTSDVNVPLAPNVGSLTVDYMNGDQQVDTQQISASDVAKWGQASGTPNVNITSSLKYPASYKLQNASNNDVTIPSLDKSSAVKVNVLPNVGKLNVTYDYDGQPVATQVINSDDLATLKTKGSDSFNVPDSMLSFPASYKLHSNTNNATMPNVGQTGNAIVNLDLNVGSIAVKYMDNGTQKGQTQTISASDVAKQRVASGQNLNITSLLNKDYPASYKLQNANDNSVTVPTVGQTASDNVSIVPNVGSLSIKYIEPGGQQEGSTQDLSASDLASLNAGPNAQNVDVTALLNRNDYPQSYVLKNSTNNVTMPAIGQTPSDNVQLVPNVSSINVTYQYKGKSQGSQTISSDALAKLGDAAGTSNVNITGLLSGYPASYKLAGDTKVTVPSKSAPLNINVDLTPNIGDTRVDYNYNGQRGATTLSASDLVSFNEAAGSNVNVYSKLGSLPAGYQLNQSSASDTLPELGQTNTINVSVKPIQETDTINYVYNDNGTSRNEGSNRPSGDDSATGLPDSSFKITNTPTGLHQGFNVVNPNQSIPYDSKGHTVDVTPQKVSVTIAYKSGDSTVGTHTYTGPVSATGLSSDQFSIGNRPAGLSNGYNVSNSSQNISYSSQNVNVPVTPEKLRVPFTFETDDGTPVMSGLTSANQLTVNSSSDLQISPADLTSLKDKWYRLEDQNNSVKVTPSDLNSDGQYVADPQVIKVTPRTITVPVQYMYNSHNAGNVNLTGTMNHSVNVLNDSLPAGYQLGSNPALTGGYRITPDQTNVNTGKTNPVTVNVTPKQLTDTIIYRLNGNPDNSIGSQYRPTGDDDQTQLASSKFTLGRHPQGLPSGYRVQNPSADLQYDDQTHYINVVADQMKIPYRIVKSDKTNSDLMASQTSSSFTTGHSAQALFDLANVNSQLHAQGYRLSEGTNVDYALTGSDVNDNNDGADTFNNSKVPSFTAHAINFNVPIQFKDTDNRNNTVTNGNDAEASAKINQANDLQSQIQSKLPTDYQLDSNPSLSTFRFDANDIQTGDQLKNSVTVFIKPISHNDKLTFVYNDHTYGNSDVVTGPETGPEDNFKINSVTNGKIPAGFQLKSGQGTRTLQYSTSANQVQVTPVQTRAHVNYVYPDQDNRSVATANPTGDNYATGLDDSHFKIGDKIGDSSLNFPVGWKLSNPDQVIKYDGGNYNVEITPVTENDTITFKDANGHSIGRSFTKSGNDYRTGVNGSFNINTLTAPQGYYLSSTGTVNYDNQPHTVNVKPDSDILVPFQLSDGQTGNVLVSNQDSTNKFTVTEPNQIHFNASIVPKGYQLASSNNYSYTVTPSDVTNDKFNRDPLKFQVTPITYTLPLTYEYDNANDDDPSFSKPTTLNVDSTFNLNDYIHNNVPTNYRIQSEPDVTSWKLLDHIPASGTTLSPITVRIKPVQQKAMVNYTYESTNRNAAPVDLGTGDTSAISLPSSSFEIGNQPNGLPNGYRVPNPAQKINYNGQMQTVDVAPIQKTDTVEFIYTDGNHVQHQEGSFTKVGDDSATGLSTSSFIMAGNHPNLHPGFSLAKPNQSIPFDGITHRVAVTPQSVTLTVDYMNGAHSVGSDQFTGHEEATQLDDDQFTLGSRPTGLWHGYHVTHPSQPIYYNDKTSDVPVTAESFNVPYRIVASDNHGKALNSGTSTNQVTVDTTNDHLSLPDSVDGNLYDQGYKLPDSTNFNLSHEDITKSDRFDATETPSFVASAIGFTLPIKFEDIDDGNAVVTNDYSIPNVKINQQNDVQNDVSTHLPNEYELANDSGNPDLTRYTFNSNQIAADNKLKPLVVYIKPQLHSDTVKFMYDGIQRGNSAKVSGPEAGVEDAFTVDDKVANEVPSGYQLSSGQGDRTLRYSNSSDQVQITPVQKHAHIKYVYDDNGTQLPEGTDNPQGNDVATGLADSKFEIGKNPSGLHAGFNVESAERNSVIRYNDQSYIINVVPQTTSITVTYKSGEKSVGSHQFTGPVASTQLNSDQFEIGSRPNGLWNGYYVGNPNQNISYSNGSTIVDVTPEKLNVPFEFVNGDNQPIISGLTSTNSLTVDQEGHLQISDRDLTNLKNHWYQLKTPTNSVKVTSNDVSTDGKYIGAVKIPVVLRPIQVPVKFRYGQRSAGNQTLSGVMNGTVNVLGAQVPNGYHLADNSSLTDGYRIVPTSTNVSTDVLNNPVVVNVMPNRLTDTVTYKLNGTVSIGSRYQTTGDDSQTDLPSSRFTLGRHPTGLPSGYAVQNPNAKIPYDGHNDHVANVVADRMKVPYQIVKSDQLNDALVDSQTQNDFTVGQAPRPLFTIANLNRQLHAKGYRLSDGVNVNYALTGDDVNGNTTGLDTFKVGAEPKFTAHAINFTVPLTFKDTDDDYAVVNNDNEAVAHAKINVTNNLKPQITAHLPADYQLSNNPQLSNFTFDISDIKDGNQLKTSVPVYVHPETHHDTVTFMYDGHSEGHQDVLSGPEAGNENEFKVGTQITPDKLPVGYKLVSGQSNRTLRYSNSSDQVQVTPIQTPTYIKYVYNDRGVQHPEGSDVSTGDDAATQLPSSRFMIKNVSTPGLHRGFKFDNSDQGLRYNGQSQTVYVEPKLTRVHVTYQSGDHTAGSYSFNGPVASTQLNSDQFAIGDRPLGLWHGYTVNNAAQRISYSNGSATVDVTPESFKVPFKVVTSDGQLLTTGVSTNRIQVDHQDRLNVPNSVMNSLYAQGYTLSTPLSFNLTHNDVTGDNQFNSTATPTYKATLNQMTVPVALDYQGVQKNSFGINYQTIKSIVNVISMASAHVPYGYQIKDHQNALNNYRIKASDISANDQAKPITIQLGLVQATDSIIYRNGRTSVAGGQSSIHGDELSDFKPNDLTLPTGYQLASGNATSYGYHGQPVTINVTPVRKTDALKYMYDGQQRGVTTNVTGNDVTTGLANGKFTVGDHPQGLPAGWQVVANETGQTIPYDGTTHRINVIPQTKTDTIKFMKNGDSTPISTVQRSGNDYRTVNGNFEAGSLTTPRGYHLVTTSETLPYDGNPHSVAVVPDQLRIPFNVVDSQTNRMILPDQLSTNALAVDQPNHVDMNLAMILHKKGYQLSNSNQYTYQIEPSDVDVNGRFIKTPLNFKATPVTFTLPIQFRYANSEDDNPSFNDDVTLNVDTPFNLNRYLEANVPTGYTILPGQTFSNWSLIDHLPVTGDRLNPITVQIDPTQRDAKVEYFNGKSSVDKIVDLGHGDNSTLSLASSGFKIGSTPQGLPTGYHVDNPNQKILYNNFIQKVIVEPNVESVVVSFVNQNGHNVGQGLYHGHYRDQLTTSDLGRRVANGTLQRGYAVQDNQGMLKTLGTLNPKVFVKVIGRQVSVPVEFINRQNGQPVGKTYELSTRIGNAVSMPSVPSDYEEKGTNPSDYVATDDDFQANGSKKDAIQIHVVPKPITPKHHSSTTPVVPHHSSGHSVTPAHHPNVTPIPPHHTPSDHHVAPSHHDHPTPVAPNHSSNHPVTPAHHSSVVPSSVTSGNAKPATSSSTSASMPSHNHSNVTPVSPAHHSNSAPVKPTHSNGVPTSNVPASSMSSTASSADNVPKSSNITPVKPESSMSVGPSSVSSMSTSNSSFNPTPASYSRGSSRASNSATGTFVPMVPNIPNESVVSSSVSSERTVSYESSSSVRNTVTSPVTSSSLNRSMVSNYSSMKRSDESAKTYISHKGQLPTINLTNNVTLRMSHHRDSIIQAHGATLQVHKVIKRHGKTWLLVKYHGRSGWIINNAKSLRPAYYQTKQRNFIVKALRKIQVHNVKHDGRSQVIKSFKAGTHFRVQREMVVKGVKRFYLGRGQYVTANDDYVAMPKDVQTPDYYVNFTKPTRLYVSGHHSPVVIYPHRDTLVARKITTKRGSVKIQVEYHGHLGWIDNNYGIRPAYYQTHRKNFTVETLRPIHLYDSKNFTSSHNLKLIDAGQKLLITKVVKFRNQTRLYLSQGYYVTGNNDFVKII